MTDTSINKTAFFAAPRETVWMFLTDKDKLAQWFFQAEADLAQGHTYTLFKKAEDGSIKKMCWGTVLEMNKPTHLVYTFTISPLNGAMTTVRWKLEEAHGGTRLSLSHDGIGEAAGQAALNLLMALEAGWDQHIADLRGAVKTIP